MEILLIKPFSINKAWAGRRFKTPEYKAWREEALLHLRGHPYAPSGEIEVHIKFYLKRMTSDVDNCIKPFLDALTDSQRIKDDRYIMKLTVEKIKTNTKDEEERVEYKFKKMGESSL